MGAPAELKLREGCDRASCCSIRPALLLKQGAADLKGSAHSADPSYSCILQKLAAGKVVATCACQGQICDPWQATVRFANPSDSRIGRPFDRSPEIIKFCSPRGSGAILVPFLPLPEGPQGPLLGGP